MSVAEYVEKKFGFPTRAIENPVRNTLTTTAAIVLYQNPDRFQWLIINLGDYDIYVAFKSDVSRAKGIRIPAGGGYASMHVDEDGEAVTYELWGISPDGTVNIYVVEYEKR